MTRDEEMELTMRCLACCEVSIRNPDQPISFNYCKPCIVSNAHTAIPVREWEKNK